MALTPAGPQQLARLRTWIMGLSGWRRAFTAFTAGGISVLGFAPFFVSPILFLTFPILVWLIDGSSGPRRAASAGWWFGFGYFFLSLFWIGEAFLVEADKFAMLLPFAVTLLPAGLALFYAAATAVARRYWYPGISRVLILAVSLACVEWLRGHVLTGFPWNVLGYALTAPDTLMQSAALAGVYALTIPAVVIFAAPFVLLSDGRAFWKALAFAALPLGLLWGYGAWRLPAGSVETAAGVKLRLVQPSVPQREKWLPEFQARIFDDHLALSRRNPQGSADDLQGVTHVIWPEAAIPFLPLEHPEALAAIAGMLPKGGQLITGALRRAKPVDPGFDAGSSGAQGFNSLLAIKDDGSVATVYDKIHLVPFGEYLPFETLLGAIGLTRLAHGHGSFLAGAVPRPLLFITGLPPVGGLICYEVLFPGTIVQSGERPGVLLNLTNDGWFGSTIGPPGHFHQARVRAVEEGIPLIRVANNGISGVIDPFGRAIYTLGLNVRGVIDSPLPARISPTWFARFGDLGLLILASLSAGLAFRTARNPND